LRKRISTIEINEKQPIKPAGRPATGSFEQYEQAVSALADESGRLPSQRAIRRYLGSGSNSTLSNYQRQLIEQSLASGQQLERDPAESKLSLHLNELMRQLSSEAAQIADDRVDEIEQSAKKRILASEQMAEKRTREAYMLTLRSETIEADLQSARKELSEVVKKLDMLRTEHATLVERNARMKEDLSHRDANIELLDSELASSKEKLTESDELHALSTAKQSSRLEEISNQCQSLEKENVRLLAEHEKHTVLLNDAHKAQERKDYNYRLLKDKHAYTVLTFQELNDRLTVQTNALVHTQDLHKRSESQYKVNQQSNDKRVSVLETQLREKDRQIELLALALGRLNTKPDNRLGKA